MFSLESTDGTVLKENRRENFPILIDNSLVTHSLTMKRKNKSLIVFNSYFLLLFLHLKRLLKENRVFLKKKIFYGRILTRTYQKFN